MRKLTLKYMRRFLSLPFRDKMLFGEAVLFLFSAKLMLLILPFRICILTVASNQYSGHPQVEILQQVKNAIARANRLSCWKNICLVQAFAARWMLQRRKIGSSLSIGIKQEPEKIMSAHAWLMVGSREIVSSSRDYLPIVRY